MGLFELAIQSTSVVFIVTAAVLFDELDDRINDFNEDKSQMTRKLYEWKRHYDLVCCLVENINKVFGFILFLIIGYLMTEMIYFAYEFMLLFNEAKFDEKTALNFFYYNQILLRLFPITISSWYMKNKVNKK